MADPIVERNYRCALAAFLVAVVAFSIGTLSKIVYLFLVHGALNTITEFAWGHIPPERLNAFIWLSEAMGPILIGCFLVSGIATMVLFYFAALSLRRVGMKQYFGPALTAWSLIIPFYSLYRPWAGLGEVRNTLAQAQREQRLPAAGITGANAATVFYAIMMVIYSVAGYVLGIYADQISASSGNLTGAAGFTSYLNEMFNLFSLFIIVELIFLAAVVWYWVGMFWLIKASLSLQLTVADLSQGGPPPVPAPA